MSEHSAPVSPVPSGPVACPICGATADGAYCARCGAALTPRNCEACHAKLAPVATFCHRCGRAVTAPTAVEADGRKGGRAEQTSSRTPWLVAGILIIVFLAVMIGFLLPGKDGPRRADMANVGNAPPGGGVPSEGAAPVGGPGGAPPDISALTPEQRFVRLSDRVLNAAAAGDSSTLTAFAPMALAAYGMLPATTPGLRYRAAMINVNAGNYPAALLIADSIVVAAPNHLLGLLIRGEVARRQGDSARLAAALAEFAAAYPAEIARTDRPEYEEFRSAIEGFRP